LNKWKHRKSNEKLEEDPYYFLIYHANISDSQIFEDILENLKKVF